MAGFMDISANNLVIKSNTRENILCASDYTTILTKCRADDGIAINQLINYSPNMIGYTYVISSNTFPNIAASSSTTYALTTATTSIPRGVYIINIQVGLQAQSVSTNFNFISSGLSTSTTAYSSGTGVFTTLNESVLTSASITNQNVYGMDCRPFDLSGNSYHLVINASVNKIVGTISYCSCSCTRIA
jgi:hypothetical protein